MIELINVSKKFDGRGIAGINGISLSLQRGEILSIMGPNGSGKSTLINLISGSLSPDSGLIRLEGEVSVFRGIEASMDMNVQAYLMSANKQEISEEKKLQLARDFADIFEFTFQLRQYLSELSAGQRQKVALAAVLTNRPAVLLMDEPFSHLDPHTRRDILKSLFTYIKNQDLPALWVTHDLDEALNFSDRLGILNFGKLEQIGRPDHLVRDPRNLFVAQFVKYENFIPVKKTGSLWQTPWGEQSFVFESSSQDALLVIPAESWEFKGKKQKVVSHSFKGYSRAFIVRVDENELTVTLKRSEDLPLIGSQIGIMPDFINCFLIPL